MKTKIATICILVMLIAFALALCISAESDPGIESFLKDTLTPLIVGIVTSIVGIIATVKSIISSLKSIGKTNEQTEKLDKELDENMTILVGSIEQLTEITYESSEEDSLDNNENQE